MERDRLQFVTQMHKKNPQDSFLAFAAAVENQMAGNRKRAMEICEDIIDHDPEYVDAYYKLGKMFENSNNFEKAIKAYRQGIEVARKMKNEKCLGELSEALMLLGDENW